MGENFLGVDHAVAQKFIHRNRQDVCQRNRHRQAQLGMAVFNVAQIVRVPGTASYIIKYYDFGGHILNQQGHFKSQRNVIKISDSL